jgi:hypothetical protein
MPLTWDISEIENYEDLKIEAGENDQGEKLWKLDPLTDGFIWATLAIGIGHWTGENAAEVYTRLKFLERIDGCLMYEVKDGVRADRPLTPEDVARHIGLRTNVALESRTKWLNRQSKMLAQQIEGEYKRWALAQFGETLAAKGGEAA